MITLPSVRRRAGPPRKPLVGPERLVQVPVCADAGGQLVSIQPAAMPISSRAVRAWVENGVRTDREFIIDSLLRHMSPCLLAFAFVGNARGWWMEQTPTGDTTGGEGALKLETGGYSLSV